MAQTRQQAIEAALRAILVHPRTDDRSIVLMAPEVAAAKAALAMPEDGAPNLKALLSLALPYVQKVAATAPTEPERCRRQRQASHDVAAIRAAIMDVSAA